MPPAKVMAQLPERGLMTEENAHSDFPTSTPPRLYVAAWLKD